MFKTKEQLRAERLWKQMLAQSFEPSDWYQRDDPPEPQKRQEPERNYNKINGQQQRLTAVS